MVAHLKGPYWVEIESITAGGGPHTLTRPTNEWVGVPLEAPGAFVSWAGPDIAAPTMIEALVDLMLPLVTTATTFSSWIVYRQLETDERPVIMTSGILSGKVGEAPTTDPFLAWMKTYTFRTADNFLAKFEVLDTPTDGRPSKTPVVTGDELLLVNALMSTANAWAGRDGSRLAIFRGLSNTLNDALVRAYRL
jgi:hypothetical protein